MRKLKLFLMKLFRKTAIKLERQVETADYGNIGRHCYGPLAKPNQYDMNFIESIGSFCSFATGVTIAQPHYMGVTTHQFLFSSWRYPEFDKLLPNDKQKQIFDEHITSKKIKIGNDVWIGQNAVIIAGVNIGDGAVIGAGAVVTKDIPDYAIAVGVPARVIKYRYDENQIILLKKIKWWEWSDKQIAERFDDFLNIDEFLKKYSGD